MVLVSFSIDDKTGRLWFFKDTFLIVNINIDIVLGMPFFTTSNVKINFLKWKLNWKLYTIVETFLIIKQVKVEKKKFIAAAFDFDDKIFVVYVVSFTNTNVYLFCRA